jgi:hypothetical protein
MAKSKDDQPKSFGDAANQIKKQFEEVVKSDNEQKGEEGQTPPEDATQSEGAETAEGSEADVPGLTPEEQKLLQEIEAEYAQKKAQEDRRSKVLDMFTGWASGVDPELQQRVDQLAQERQQAQSAQTVPTPDPNQQRVQSKTDTMQQEFDQVSSNLDADVATTQPPGNNQLVPLQLSRPIQSVNHDSFKQPLQTRWLNTETLKRVYGIDPNAVPASLANGLQDLINHFNREIANANFFYHEGKKAYEARDEYKNQLLRQEWNDALRSEGINPTKETDVLFEEARSKMFDPVTKQKVPFTRVIEDLSKDYPKIFAPDPTPAQQAQQQAAQQQQQQQQAFQTPSPPQGSPVTRNPEPQQGQSTEKPKTFDEARKQFHAAMQRKASS